MSTSSSYWLLENDLDPSGDIVVEWNKYILNLNSFGIRLSDKEDILVWDWKDTNGVTTAKKSYEAITFNQVKSPPKWWAKYLWKWRIPLKLK